MAKIEKLKKDVEGVATTVYPVTIPQAVIDPTSGKSARSELDEKANHGYESGQKTLKAVDDSKVDKSSIVGETGQGDTTVMHQKAVTDELSAKANHGYESNPKTLKEVDDDLAQLAGDTNVKMSNIVTNGNFVDGTINPFAPYLGSAAHSGGNVILTASGGGAFSIFGAIVGNWALNKKVYFKTRFRALDAGASYITSSLRKSNISGLSVSNFVQINNPVQNQWYDVSEIATGTDTTEIWITNFIGYSTSAGATGKRLEVDYNYAIVLSDVFGYGNEPTKSEMDLLISIMGVDYFEGQVTIPAQKVMQWQLKMIRQNRNAIVALGGTII